MITNRSGFVKPVTTIILISLLFITGCTKKNNLTGNNWSDARPMVTADSSFTLGYSFTKNGKVAGSETRLLCGMENGIETMAMMQFTDFPDSVTVVGQPTLKLVGTRRSSSRRSPLILSFYRINRFWRADSTSLVSDTDLEPLSIANFTVQDTLDSHGDTLTVANITIPIPNAVLEEIINTDQADTLGLAIKVVNPGWLEIKSREGLNGPLLAFTYRNIGESTDNEYSERPSKDSFRVTGTADAVTDNIWCMKNLLPQRMYFKFNLPDSIFTNEDGTHLTPADIKRMTINKAELVLFAKNNPYYTTVKSGFYPYIVTKDSLTSAVQLTDDDLGTITNTLSSSPAVITDSVKIDITAIMQGLTSGDTDNNGIVIKSLQEMQNYGNVEFWHYTNAPAGKKPYVRITYTPPYLKSR